MTRIESVDTEQRLAAKIDRLNVEHVLITVYVTLLEITSPLFNPNSIIV